MFAHFEETRFLAAFVFPVSCSGRSTVPFETNDLGTWYFWALRRNLQVPADLFQWLQEGKGNKLGSF